MKTVVYTCNVTPTEEEHQQSEQYEYFIKYTTNTQRQYCKANGYDYFCFDRSHPKHPKPKNFKEVCYQYIWHLNKFYDYDVIVKLDADMVAINNDPFPETKPGVVSTNTRGHKYVFNPGLMIMDPEIAKILYEHFKENYDPYTEWDPKMKNRFGEYGKVYSDQAQLAYFFKDNPHLLDLSVPLKYQAEWENKKHYKVFFHPCGVGSVADKMELILECL